MNVIEELEARFVESVAATRHALAAARAEPWVRGSRGQLVAHPGFGVAAKLEMVAVRIAAELRLAGKQRRDERTGFDAFDELERRRRGRS